MMTLRTGKSYKIIFATLITALILVMLPAARLQAKGLHDEFTSLLSEYVKDGKVNYKGLKNDARLAHYLTQLADTDPQTLGSDKDRLAFWINAYNAYTLKIICDNYPVKSILELGFDGLYLSTLLHNTVWDKPLAIINHHTYTLNYIEHKIIRPVFKDPRVHFALVCASKSCAALRSEAYEGDRLDQQLDYQTTAFLADHNKNDFDTRKQIAYLSSIFKWYAADFGKNKSERLLLISKFLPEAISDQLKADPAKWKINYLPYDWRLNE